MAKVTFLAYQSTGLTRIKITALSAEAEPQNHHFPLLKQKEALPDYQVFVVLQKSRRLNPGTKPEQSAVNGIDWKLPSPVSFYDIASITRQDDDNPSQTPFSKSRSTSKASPMTITRSTCTQNNHSPSKFIRSSSRQSDRLSLQLS